LKFTGPGPSTWKAVVVARTSVVFNLDGFKVVPQTMRDVGVFGAGNGRRRVLVRDPPISWDPW